jgi:hypothetical protein
MKASIFICALITVTLTGFAQESSSSREQLKQYVADLQKNQQLKQYAADLQKSPDDQALREKIIKLALTVDPLEPPA